MTVYTSSQTCFPTGSKPGIPDREGHLKQSQKKCADRAASISTRRHWPAGGAFQSKPDPTNNSSANADTDNPFAQIILFSRLSFLSFYRSTPLRVFAKWLLSIYPDKSRHVRAALLNLFQ
jgi:hypothetical protein